MSAEFGDVNRSFTKYIAVSHPSPEINITPRADFPELFESISQQSAKDIRFVQIKTRPLTSRLWSNGVRIKRQAGTSEKFTFGKLEIEIPARSSGFRLGASRY